MSPALTPTLSDVVPLEPPPASSPRRPRYVMWHLAIVGTGLLLGASILLLAHKYFSARLFPAPVVSANFALITTPNADFTASIIAAIGQAKSGGEILIGARTLSSERLLTALQERAKDVTIKVLLDPETNRSADSGSAGWLIRKKVAEVYFDALPSTNQFVVVDRTFVFIGSTPFSADAPATTATTGIFVSDQKLANQLRNHFFERIAQGREASR